MSDTDSKHAVEHREQSRGQANTHLDAEFGGTEARRVLEKRLLRKLDLRMSVLIFIYILNYIDRNNAAAARLRGFEEDLGLNGQQFPSLDSGGQGCLKVSLEDRKYELSMGYSVIRIVASPLCINRTEESSTRTHYIPCAPCFPRSLSRLWLLLSRWDDTSSQSERPQ
ncbi:hypothetical protein RSAG8_11639, partial [Rhizoctonia solani AG-8 WAC10335]